MEVAIEPGKQPDRTTHASSILTQHVEMIRKLRKRSIEDVVEIGGLLSECKRLLEHGQWLPWLRRELSWSERTARNYIGVHEFFAAKPASFADLSLDLTSLYLLIAPSTPPEVREEVIHRARAGEVISRGDVRRVVQQAKRHPRTSNQAQPGVSVTEVLERTGRKVLRKLTPIENRLWFDMATTEGEEIAREWAETRAMFKLKYRDLLLSLDFLETASKPPIKKIVDAIPVEQRSTTAERLRVASEFLTVLRARLMQDLPFTCPL